MGMDFGLHKKNILSREDKSRKGSWDDKIVGLCSKINNNPEYCTTSSCSGRILIISNNAAKKHEAKYLFVSHEKICDGQVRVYFNDSNNKSLFQVQSAIVHVACKDIESARRLMQKARDCGFRRSGIINTMPCTVEIISDDSMQIPIIFESSAYDDTFFDRLCLMSNSALEKTWAKIRRLEEEL